MMTQSRGDWWHTYCQEGRIKTVERDGTKSINAGVEGPGSLTKKHGLRMRWFSSEQRGFFTTTLGYLPRIIQQTFYRWVSVSEVVRTRNPDRKFRLLNGEVIYN
jgi:hypothetical protein